MPRGIGNDGPIEQHFITNPTFDGGQAKTPNVNSAASKPKADALPKKAETRTDIAIADLKSGFGMILDLIKSPFSFLAKNTYSEADPELKAKKMEDMAQNIFSVAVLPATVPAALLGAVILTPIALVSGLIAFGAKKSTLDLVKPDRSAQRQEMAARRAQSFRNDVNTK